MATQSDSTTESRQHVLEALGHARSGTVFDLASGWWRGMPGHSAHPQFDVVTYRTPRGERNQQDLDFLSRANNPNNYGFVSELVLGTTHTGTHIDALCHVTCGSNNEWHGGESADDLLGDFGALSRDASYLAPIIARGVMLDIPVMLERETLAANFAIGAEQLEQAANEQKVQVRQGDVVLIRTGQMKYWPNDQSMMECQDAGVSLDGAKWLQARGVRAVGTDTAAFEVAPSGVEGWPQPVHVFLIKDHGIPIMEWVLLEGLSEAKAYEFTFLSLPLTIRGATGSMIRPIAVC
ncbi:MAG: cyclase family protein [Chloroflexota bacterium]|nr:MAG: cyclase [Chloroflexota bacterium]